MDLDPYTNNANMFESNYLSFVKKDELKRSTEMYKKSKNPLETGIVPTPAYSSMFQNIEEEDYQSNYVSSLTGEKVKVKDLKHNNMQPFLKGNVTQNVEKFTPKLDMNTGNNKLHIQKKELEGFFKPVGGFDNINGSPIYNNDYLKSRIEISKINNNVTPIEKIYVGPGLNKGYTSQGTGGFQQIDTLEYSRPKNMEELRSKINQKDTYFEIPFQAHAKGMDKRSVVTPYSKNKPEKTYSQTADNWFKSKSVITKDKMRPEINMKETVRPDVHVEYSGNMKFENIKGMSYKDDYGKDKILLNQNERTNTVEKTRVSNVTNTIKAFISPIMDAMKYTLKEYMVDAPRANGNSSAQIPKKLTVYNPDDVPNTTVKETLIHDSDLLNLTGPDGTYTTLHDEAKTTVKETLVHDSEYLNVKFPQSSSYVKNEDKMKTTTKETLPIVENVRNIGKGTYKVYMYNPDIVPKKTVKETTIKCSSSSIGNNSGIYKKIGAYLDKNIDLKLTNKQFTSDNEDLSGTAKSVCEHRQRSREAEENAEIDGTREDMLINAGHTPNPGQMNIPIDKENINMKSNKIIHDSYSQRETGNVNIIYQKGPEINDCAVTKENNKGNAYENRLDGNLLESLTRNDFNISINPIKI